MPVEVFEMIRKEVVALQLADARAAIVERLCCEKCALDGKAYTGWDDPDVLECAVCSDALDSFDGLHYGNRLDVVLSILSASQHDCY